MDTEVRINIGTQADTTGAKKAQQSIASLEEEVKRLKEELRQAPLGSKEFDQLATQIGAATKKLEGAERQTKSYSATGEQAKGVSNQLGQSLLQLGYAADDAQYGFRGLANNLPQLALSLGLGPGVAGVVALAATALAVLGPKLVGLGEDAEKPKASMEAFRDLIKGIDEETKKFRQFEHDLDSTDLVEAFEDRKKAIDRDVTAMNAYTEAIKSAIKHEGDLQKSRTQLDLNQVDSRQRKGEITKDAADRQRDEIKLKAQRDELDRIKLLDDADASNLKFKLEQIEKEKAAAEMAKEAARLSADERIAEIEQIKKLASLRAQLDASISGLLQQREEIVASTLGRFAFNGKTLETGDGRGTLTNEDIERLRALANQTPSEPGEDGRVDTARNNQIAAAKEVVDAFDKLAENTNQLNEIYAKINKEAPLSLEPSVTRGKDGQEEKGPNPYEREKDRLTKGDVDEGLDSLEELKNRLKSLESAAKAAADRLKDAEQALELKQGANAQGDAQRRQLVQTNNPVMTDIEGRAAKSVEDLLEKILAQIPNAANDPAVQKLVGKIRDIEKGGINKGEVEEASQLLVKLQSKIAVDNAQRARLYQQITLNQENIISNMNAAILTMQQQGQTIKEQGQLIKGMQNVLRSSGGG